jgi:hypothetical protein
MAVSNLRYPDGLANDHARSPRGFGRVTPVLSLLVLCTLMALALSGVLAGGTTPVVRASFARAELATGIPERLRNGEFYEMRLTVTARQDIAKLRLAVTPTLWRDMTVNTMVPAAGEESFEDGAFTFDYGALRAGDRFEVKIDGQINPPLTIGTRGTIALYDGDTRIGALPVAIRVLP